MLVSFAFFTPETAATFRAAAACIVPGESDSPGGDSDSVLELADRALARRSDVDQKLFRKFLSALEILPMLRYGRGFSRLDSGRREAVLRYFERTRLVPKLRQGFFGLKTFVLMGYYGQEGSWAELGYPGPRMDAPYYQLGRKE